MSLLPHRTIFREANRVARGAARPIQGRLPIIVRVLVDTFDLVEQPLG